MAGMGETDPRLRPEVYPLPVALRPQLAPVRHADERGTGAGAARYRVMMTRRGGVLFPGDLVTGPAARSRGAGAGLLAEAGRRGWLADCERTGLDWGVASQAAYRFCRRHRMGILAPHFARDLGPS